VSGVFSSKYQVHLGLTCDGFFTLSTLILEDYPEQNLKFLEDEGIKLIQFGIPGNKVGEPGLRD
jgi:hypothetical protein